MTPATTVSWCRVALGYTGEPRISAVRLQPRYDEWPIAGTEGRRHPIIALMRRRCNEGGQHQDEAPASRTGLRHPGSLSRPGPTGLSHH
jgi:hypothetical protein